MNARLRIGIVLALAGLWLDAAPAEAQVVLDRKTRTAWYVPDARGKATRGDISWPGAGVTPTGQDSRQAPWPGTLGSVRRGQTFPPPGSHPLTDGIPGWRRATGAFTLETPSPRRGAARRMHAAPGRFGR